MMTNEHDDTVPPEGGSRSAPLSIEEILARRPRKGEAAAPKAEPGDPDVLRAESPDAPGRGSSGAPTPAVEVPPTPPKVRRPSKFAQRRSARRWALQVAYASHLSGDPGDLAEAALRRLATTNLDELDDRADLRVPQADEARLALRLVQRVADVGADYDTVLLRAIQNWRIERLTLIDHLILHLSMAELDLCPETPFKVVLNEYIEIAKEFGTDHSARFVNGVLDAVVRHLRPKEAGSPLPEPAPVRAPE